MPVRAPSRCRDCRRLHTNAGAVCATCKRARYTDRRYIYSSREWAELRDQVLSEEPLCRTCRRAIPIEVDHIIPIDAAPHLALDRTNLQALCKPCHGEKTRTER